MQDLDFLFSLSPWFILLCILAGLAYAWLLYKPATKQPWSRALNNTLFALRFVLITCLALLLLGPYIKQLKRTFEEPTLVIAIDNSFSISSIYDSARLENIKEDILHLQETLGEKVHVKIRSLSREMPLDSLNFNEKSTNLSQLMADVRTEFENRNLAGMVLLSDGIYNRGTSPTYSPYGFPVYSVGLGDTIPQKDLNLKNLYYNKIAYQGNKFRILAELEQTGFAGESVTLSVYKKGKTLGSKRVTLKEGQSLYEEEFILDATEEGLQHYVLTVSENEQEFTHANNMKHAYIEIIEGKQKILIAAPAPHPDIKAIRSAIEQNQNYEVSLFIAGLKEFKPDKYDLVILHQLPSKTAMPQLQEVLKSSSAHWYILGRQTNIPQFNQINPMIRVEQRGQEMDQVFPIFNSGFSLFTYVPEQVQQLQKFPPVIVPFGNVSLKGEAKVVLHQKVGKIPTERPLLLIQSEGEKKTAVMLGEGMWQWRLQEWAQSEQFTSFDDLMQKTVQLLSTKEDKRKFRVYPVSRDVYDSEGVSFETEIYNQLYERIWGHKVNLVLTSENGEQRNYSYVNTRNSPRFAISQLPQGIYNYKASTEVEGERLSSSGEFTVQELQLESLSLTANFNLLRTLSDKTGGRFYHLDEMDQLRNNLKQQELKSTVYAEEEFLPIINLEWLFFLFLLLISTEWFIRKYSGSY